MKRFIAVALGLIVALSVAIPAAAAATANDIVGALKEAPVYITSGTEGTNSDTAPSLMSKLYENDNIVLVMLPEDSMVVQEDVNELARKISDGLKNEKIVGLAIGTQFAGVASILPSGTATELMNRAKTVSTNSVETLSTFVRNVHDWQSAHPEQVATPKPSKADEPDAFKPWPFAAGFAIGTVIGVIILVNLNRRRVRKRVHYTAPAELNNPVRELMRSREQLRENDQMRAAIDLVCRYTETYFKRFPAEKKSTDAIKLFNNKLELAQKVVVEYVYTSKNRDFVTDADDLLARGLESIQGLAETILTSIKDRNNDRLMDYKVNTNILNAQRYRKSSK